MVVKKVGRWWICKRAVMAEVGDGDIGGDNGDYAGE